MLERRLLVSPRVAHPSLDRRAGLIELRLGDKEFDSRFAVHLESGQPRAADAARSVLHPGLRRGLLALDQAQGSLGDRPARIAMALAGDSLYLALPRLRQQTGPGGTVYETAVPLLDPGLFLCSDSGLDKQAAELADVVISPFLIIDRLPLAEVS